MSVIHGGSAAAIRFMRQHPAALAVLWLYIAHANGDGVAWPTLRGLKTETGWSVNECGEARRWLVEHGALEAVTDYDRPQWRALPPQQRARRKNLDQSEYFRATGVLVVRGKTYPLLYAPPAADVTPDVTSDAADVTPRESSDAADVTPDESSTGENAPSHVTRGVTWEPSPMTHEDAHRTPMHMQRGETELDSSTTELDSSTTQPGTSKSSSSPEPPVDLSTDGVPTERDRPKIFRLYERAIGPLTPMIADTLRLAAREWPEDWLELAFQEAADHNGRSWAYVERILERCRDERTPPGAGVARTTTHRRGRSAVAPSPSTPGPAEDLVNRLAAEELHQLPDDPPADYLPDDPLDDRTRSWRLFGRKSIARQRAQARLATHGV